MSFKVMMNGRSMTVDVLGDMPLLWVIREVNQVYCEDGRRLP